MSALCGSSSSSRRPQAPSSDPVDQFPGSPCTTQPKGGHFEPHFQVICTVKPILLLEQEKLLKIKACLRQCWLRFPPLPLLIASQGLLYRECPTLQMSGGRCCSLEQQASV